MSDVGSSNTLKISFRDESLLDSPVPILLVASRLQALQNLVFHASATLTPDAPARRGRWTSRYRGEAELSFVDAHHSTLTIEAAPVTRSTFADQAIDLTFLTLHAAATADDSELAIRVPSREARAYLFRAAEALCPDFGDDFSIHIGNGLSDNRAVTLKADTRYNVRRIISKQARLAPEFEPVTLLGRVSKIHVEVAPQKIAILTDSGRELDCFFEDDLRDQITNLVAGSLVQVSGIATLNEEREPKQINRITGVDPLSVEPVHVSRFEHGAAVHQLVRPISVDVDFRDGVWVYSAEELGLWGYASDRRDALLRLHRSFDYLVTEIAREEDDALDPVALQLKRTLNELLLKKDDA